MQFIKFFKLILKLKRIILFFLFFLNINNSIDLNDILFENENQKEEGEKEKKYTIYNKKNVIILIIKGAAPLRQFFYIWLSGFIAFSMTGEYDPKTIIAIMTTIQLLDQSIILIIEEIFEEEELNNTDIKTDIKVDTDSNTDIKTDIKVDTDSNTDIKTDIKVDTDSNIESKKI